ncbi:Replication protein C N-terminal domain protein [Roseovarius mucosus DSM 17069]|uniref:Replication protein C N-terminal domain protein n=1 Tax=Roseovarius mucosus DSM 17069 TaxID=1288298 RepID=A0A0A0HQT5_9RHOB|nr:helix-turn-helix domain-containing protein [Roseovarius mucosus]KGM89660.1 Replication protein C N-terminal domain protein [Roseovarius mucosus DSM 17069]
MTQHLTHGGLPDGMTRWEFFGLIESARRQLGLSKGAIAYLKVAISRTMDEDFLAGNICSFWTSVTKIAAQAELDRRQVARIEADLVERRLLAKTASDHSRRAGSRRDGKVGHEFGINLAPLIVRVAEIQAAARKAAFEKEEAERLRIRIKKLFGDLRRLGSDGAMEAAEEILPNRRPSTIHNFERLKQVTEALEAVWEDFSAEVSRGEKSHQCDISPALNTSKENINKTCRVAIQRDTQPVRTTPAQVALLASKPFQELIELYWSAVDNRGLLSWRTIQMAARDRADQLEIKSDVWQRQCGMLGEERTALCLMIADRNSERLDGYRVRDAAAAFIGMVRSEARQGAVINSLLGELIGNAGGQRNGA